MSKGHDGADKHEKTKETHTKEAHKDGHKEHTGEIKKPDAHKHGGPAKAKKGQDNSAIGGCAAWGCKVTAKRFNFCDEHYDHFKFGLIKKTGEPSPDYEKKFEHYQAHVAKRGARKVA
jgi:hypothetical protein